MDRASVHFTLLVIVFNLVVSLDVYGQTVGDEQAPQAAPQADKASTSKEPVTSQPAPTDNDNAPKMSTEPSNDPLEEYRAHALYIKHSFWRGLQVFRAGIPLDVGLFGDSYKNIFAGSPAALDSMSKYRTMRITGGLLGTIGLALLITDIVLIATESSSVVSIDDQGNKSAKPLVWILLALGGAIDISGGLIGAGAYGHLTDAVEQYNADLVLRIRDKPANLTMRRAPGLSVRGSF